MTSYMDDDDLEDTPSETLRPCHCVEDDNIERNYCFAEGTMGDSIRSENDKQLSENIWYKIKPPRLFTKEFHPTITARQVHIARILLEGKSNELEDEDEEKPPEKVTVTISKKKSAVRFLSKVHISE